MLLLMLRNPETDVMEKHFVETAREAENMCLKTWPDCTVNAHGEVVVKKEIDLMQWPGHDSYRVMGTKTIYVVVARICFTDKM